MQEWLKKSQQGKLIMCHPGRESTNIKDPIRNARLREYNYLMSDDFLNDLKTHNLDIF
jgi:hypothetical protein